ncbi:MAG: class II aldolase/adducin family protein [Deltaproteobacteria bacterium]
MERYIAKLKKEGLVTDNICFLNANNDAVCRGSVANIATELKAVRQMLAVDSILLAMPDEPYRTILNYFTDIGDASICPNDSESKTILQILPVVSEFDVQTVFSVLKQAKSIIIPNVGIVSYGKSNSSQAYVIFSAVCFSLLVKFLVDILKANKRCEVSDNQKKVLQKIMPFFYDLPRNILPALMKGPFTNKQDAKEAIIEAGERIVSLKLVNSFFGNISYLFNDILLISKTGSFLDELANDIVEVSPVKPKNADSIASSELPAHREIISQNMAGTVLHGHPIFAVVMSLVCDDDGCKFSDNCSQRCPYERFICDIPIVSGEIGGGKFGLDKTVPIKLKNNKGVIVYGHGVFCVGKNDFEIPLQSMLEIETLCRAEYLKKMQKLVLEV